MTATEPYILQIKRAYECDHTVVTFRNNRRFCNQMDGRSLEFEYDTTTLGALRSFLESMFAAFFHHRNSQSLRPLGQRLVNLKIACPDFNIIINFPKDHNNQTLRQEMGELCEENHEHLKRDIDYYGLL